MFTFTLFYLHSFAAAASATSPQHLPRVLGCEDTPLRFRLRLLNLLLQHRRLPTSKTTKKISLVVSPMMASLMRTTQKFL